MDAYPGQPLDFFGALRSRRYDGTIRAWAAALGSEAEVNKRLLAALREEEGSQAGLPDFASAPAANLASMLLDGARLAEEQEAVLTSRLSDAYFKNMHPGAGAGIAFGG